MRHPQPPSPPTTPPHTHHTPPPPHRQAHAVLNPSTPKSSQHTAIISQALYHTSLRSHADTPVTSPELLTCMHLCLYKSTSSLGDSNYNLNMSLQTLFPHTFIVTHLTSPEPFASTYSRHSYRSELQQSQPKASPSRPPPAAVLAPATRVMGFVLCYLL